MAAGQASRMCAARAESAQTERKESHLLRARESLISCADESCPKAIRTDCVRWLAEVDGDIPSIVVKTTTGNGVEVTDVRVYIDSVLVEQRIDGAAIRVDPGKRVVRMERGSASVSQEIVAHVGDRNRPVRLSFPAAVDGKKPGEPVAKTAVQLKPTDAPHKSVAPWVVGALGLAALGGGAFLTATGWKTRGYLANSCAPTHSCSNADVSAAKTKILAGDLTMAGGAVVLAIALYLALTATSVQADTPKANASSFGILRF